MSSALRRFGKIRTLWDYLRTSFWFVPGLMMLAAAGLAVAGWAGDGALARIDGERLPWFVFVSAPDDARDVLSTLLGSMMTMASLVFSITMVVLSLAASQFGPRLIRSFMASPHTQFVLGTFVMTIVYCLVVLAFLTSREGDGTYAHLTVTIALLLTLVSVLLLVVFLHALARSIVSETVIERVGRELDDLTASFEVASPVEDAKPIETLPAGFEERAARFGTAQSGYVQTVEFETLTELAEELDIVIGFYFRPGDFVGEGGRDIAVFPAARLTDELVERVRQVILIGVHRTPVQDPEFSIRHLVEIAVRALSSAVNDPYTAIAVIDRLSASLSLLLERKPPSGVHRGRSGAVRVACPMPTHASLLGAAFDQIRQNGAGMPVVVIHLLDAIGRIADHARLPGQSDLLEEHLRIITEAAGRRIQDPADLSDIARRAEDIRVKLAVAARTGT